MLKRALIFVLLLSASSLSLLAQDEAALKQRIQARADAVAELLASGLAQEGPNGTLQASGPLDPQPNGTLQDENKDRQAVFTLISARSGLPVDEVGKMYAARARKAVPVAGPPVYGPCKLVPARSPDVSRLLQYLKQGMNYASQKKYDLALAEFQPALAIDKNFLGLSQNVGSAQLSLKKYSEAETAFKSELKLVDCLSPLNDTQLAQFAYFMEVEERDAAKKKKAQADKLKVQLPVVRAAVHYNLACVYSLQKQKDQALAELRAAVEAGFSDKKALNGDPDLAFVRTSPEFREVVAKVR